MSDEPVLWVECPNCDAEGISYEVLRDWDRDRGGFLWTCCGERNHLDEENGGARTWLAPKDAKEDEEREWAEHISRLAKDDEETCDRPLGGPYRVRCARPKDHDGECESVAMA